MYREWVSFLAELSPDERNHFIPKAHGAEHGEFAWYFVGREAERQQIAEWLLARRNGMLIVTGSAGCGKSALLGNVVVLANPALRDLLVRGARWRPPTRFNARLIMRSTQWCTYPGCPLAILSADWPRLQPYRCPPRSTSGRKRTWTTWSQDWPSGSLRYWPTRLTRPATLSRSRAPAAPHRAAARRTRDCRNARRHRRRHSPLDAGGEPLLNALDGPHHTDLIRLAHDPLAIETYVRQRLSDARLMQRIDVGDDLIGDVAWRLDARIVEVVGNSCSPGSPFTN